MHPQVTYRVFSRFRGAYWSNITANWVEDPGFAKVFLDRSDPELKELLDLLRKNRTVLVNSPTEIVVSKTTKRRKNWVHPWCVPSPCDRDYFVRFDDWGRPVLEVMRIDAQWVVFFLGKKHAQYEFRVREQTPRDLLRDLDAELFLGRKWKSYSILGDGTPEPMPGHLLSKRAGQCTYCGSFGAMVRMRDAGNVKHWFHHSCALKFRTNI